LKKLDFFVPSTDIGHEPENQSYGVVYGKCLPVLAMKIVVARMDDEQRKNSVAWVHFLQDQVDECSGTKARQNVAAECEEDEKYLGLAV
jgi:hypothetical protein